MPSTNSSNASSNGSRKRTAPNPGKKSKSKARKRGQSSSKTQVAHDQPRQTINQSESAGRTRVQSTFLRRKYSTLLKLKIFLEDEETENLEEFTAKARTLLRVLQQEDELVLLAKYWISPGDIDEGKLTRPRSVLTRAAQIPEKMGDLKQFFSGLRLRDESTVSWTTIRVNSEIDLKGRLGDVEGELRDHGIQLFLLPIQDCRTKVIGIIPQMPSNSDLVFYKDWLLRRLAAAMGEEVQIALYLRTPWIGKDRRDSHGHRLPKFLRKMIHVETQTRFADEVFTRLKRIIRGSEFRRKTNSKPALAKPVDPQGPSSTRLLMLEAIKMHEVMERSMDTLEVPGILELDRANESRVPLRTLVLSHTSSDGHLMFVNVERTGDGSTCSVGFPRKYREEARDYLKDLGFRVCEEHGVLMQDYFTPSEVSRIKRTKRVNGVVRSPEEMEVDSLAQPQAWFDLSLLYTDTDTDGQPEFSIEEVRTIRSTVSTQGSEGTWGSRGTVGDNATADSSEGETSDSLGDQSDLGTTGDPSIHKRGDDPSLSTLGTTGGTLPRQEDDALTTCSEQTSVTDNRTPADFPSDLDDDRSLSEDSDTRMMGDFVETDKTEPARNASRGEKGPGAGIVVSPDKATREVSRGAGGSEDEPPGTEGGKKEAPRRSPRIRLVKGANTGATHPDPPDRSAPSGNEVPEAAGDE